MINTKWTMQVIFMYSFVCVCEYNTILKKRGQEFESGWRVSTWEGLKKEEE